MNDDEFFSRLGEVIDAIRNLDEGCDDRQEWIMAYELLLDMVDVFGKCPTVKDRMCSFIQKELDIQPDRDTPSLSLH